MLKTFCDVCDEEIETRAAGSIDPDQTRRNCGAGEHGSSMNLSHENGTWRIRIELDSGPKDLCGTCLATKLVELAVPHTPTPGGPIPDRIQELWGRDASQIGHPVDPSKLLPGMEVTMFLDGTIVSHPDARALPGELFQPHLRLADGSLWGPLSSLARFARR